MNFLKYFLKYPNAEDISDTSGARKTGDLIFPFMEVENLPFTASSPKVVD